MALAAQVRSDKLPHKTHLSLIYFVCQKLVVLRQMPSTSCAVPGLTSPRRFIVVLNVAQQLNGEHSGDFRVLYLPAAIVVCFFQLARAMFSFLRRTVSPMATATALFSLCAILKSITFGSLKHSHTPTRKQGSARCVCHTRITTLSGNHLLCDQKFRISGIYGRICGSQDYTLYTHMACSTSFTTDYYYYNGSFCFFFVLVKPEAYAVYSAQQWQ